MRWLLAGLVFILLVLQYRLWIAEGSLAERHRLQQQIEEQARINSELETRNAALEREVLELQSGNKGLEQRAREQLGLIRQGETFYQFVDGPAAAPGAEPAPAKTTVGEAAAEPSTGTSPPAGAAPAATAAAERPR
ncbi:MAG: septum formation initiator family protein [Pseudomonadales bacterium]|nr:septum formation initiator family protein [Pseudomonadales bacterium]